MLKKILIALAAIIAVFLIVVALQPSEFKVERSATIAAPPAAVFDQVNDFHKWEAWSPWAKLDPNAKVAFEGPPSGTGTIMTWYGNDKVGQGKMTLTESKPNELVKINVEFVKPFEGSGVSQFELQARRRSDRGDLDHVRPPQLPREGDVPRLQRQEDDGRTTWTRGSPT